MNLVEVKNLDLTLASGEKKTHVLKEVSFSIKKKSITALIGESGSGKSLTALSLVKLISPNIISKIKGEINFHGKNILDLSTRELERVRLSDIAFIFQDPLSSLNPTHRIGKQIQEKLHLANQFKKALSKKEIEEKAFNLLERVKLTPASDFLSRFPHELSGGQRQRVMICIALANDSKLLVADEPTTSLDVTTQEEIINLLLQLKKERSLTILFITHDLSLVKHFADEVVVLEKGVVVEKASKKNIFQNPKNPYTKKLFNAIPQALKKRNIKSDNLLEVKQAKVFFPIKSKFLKLTQGYVKAVDDISFNVKRGSTLGIIGESGSGKTTLIKAILRLIPLTEGKILFEGNEFQGLRGKELAFYRSNIQVVFQDPFSSLSPRMSMQEIILEGLKLYRPDFSDEEFDSAFRQVLDDIGLDYSKRNSYPHEFSGGQRQRIALARVLIMKPKLILLDEPTSSLDITFQIQIIELLLHLQKKYNLTYLFISHDINVVRALADEIVVILKGKIVERGSNEMIIKNPQANYTKKLIKASWKE